MNLLLIANGDIDDDGVVRLRDRRHRHIRQVLKLLAGDQLRAGALDGQLGTGEVLSIDDDSVELRVQLDAPPPEPIDLTVVLALPRPKMLRRILRGLAEVGVKHIHLINSYRVEKAFWQSPLLQELALTEALLSGLEQAMDTVLPTVKLHTRFRPFAEDVLPSLCADREALLAHPGGTEPFPRAPRTPGLLVIGPEGGFIPFEVDLISRAGATVVNLGSRILRVETALHCALGPYLLSRA